MRPDAGSSATVILVMTCALSPRERLTAARRQLDEHLGDWTGLFVQGAVAGDDAATRLLDSSRARMWSKHPLTPTEVACYTSHRRCWEVLLNGPWEQALVMEDDFLLRDPETVRKALHSAGLLLSQGRNLVKLFDYPRSRPDDYGLSRHVGGLTLMKWKRPRAGTVGYLVSRDGAQRLLARRKVFRAVDEDIRLYWELGLDVWSVPGNPVTDNGEALGGSLLEQGRRKSRNRLRLRAIKGFLIGAYRTVANLVAFRQAFRRQQSARPDRALT